MVIHVINTLQFVKSHGVDLYPMLLYQACINPYSTYELPLLKLLPVDQLMIYTYAIIFICSNFYLFRFLQWVENFPKLLI